MAKTEYEYPLNGDVPHPKFPVPFSGIEMRIVAESEAGLASMVRKLQRCGHGHNFAVELDTSIRSSGAVWVSRTGAYCITDGKIGDAS